MWKLKKNQPPFEAVDGEFSGQQFVHDKEYKEIPIADKQRFERVEKVTVNPVKIEEVHDA